MAINETLAERLRAWTWRDSRDLLGEVAASGPEGGFALADQLRGDRGWSERVYLAAALGDATGNGGITELRIATQATGPHTVDLRCASLLALAKRLHAAATPDLIAGLADRERTVRDYALLGLGAWGDESAWDVMLAEFKNRLKRPSKRRQHSPSEGVALCYLVRTSSRDQIAEVAAALKQNWPLMKDQVRDSASALWPALGQYIEAGAPLAVPDQQKAREWFVSRCRGLFPGIE